MTSQTISEKRWHNKTKITFDVKKRSPSLCLDGSGFHSNIIGLVSHGDGKKKDDNARADGLWQGITFWLLKVIVIHSDRRDRVERERGRDAGIRKSKTRIYKEGNINMERMNAGSRVGRCSI